MNLIFAVDKNFNIGFQGDMLFHIKKDLKHFKDMTSNNIIIMGRKTFESLPGKKPLNNRINIILSRNQTLSIEGAYVVNNHKELKELLEKINPYGTKQVFLIGGGHLVQQLIDYCSFAYITKVQKEYDEFDTSIPNLDKMDNWLEISSSEEFIEKQGKVSYKFSYHKYINTEVKDF